MQIDYNQLEIFSENIEMYETHEIQEFINNGILDNIVAAIENCKTQDTTERIRGRMYLLEILKNLVSRIYDEMCMHKPCDPVIRKIIKTGIYDIYSIPNYIIYGQGDRTDDYLAIWYAMHFVNSMEMDEKISTDYLRRVVIPKRTIVEKKIGEYSKILKVDGFLLPELNNQTIVMLLKNAGLELIAKSQIKKFSMLEDLALHACLTYEGEGSLFLDVIHGIQTAHISKEKLAGCLSIGCKLIERSTNEAECQAVGVVLSEALYRSKFSSYPASEDHLKILSELKNPKIDACLMIRSLDEASLRVKLSASEVDSVGAFIEKHGLNDYIRQLTSKTECGTRKELICYLYGSTSRKQKANRMKKIFNHDLDL